MKNYKSFLVQVKEKPKDAIAAELQLFEHLKDNWKIYFSAVVGEYIYFILEK